MSTECTDVPGPTALSKGWTCQDALENNGQESMLENCQASGWTAADTCGLTCTKIGARGYDYCLNSLLTQWVYGTQFDQSPYSVTMDVHPDVVYDISIDLLSTGMSSETRYFFRFHSDNVNVISTPCCLINKPVKFKA